MLLGFKISKVRKETWLIKGDMLFQNAYVPMRINSDSHPIKFILNSNFNKLVNVTNDSIFNSENNNCDDDVDVSFI